MKRSFIIVVFCLIAIALMSFENIYNSLLYSSGAPAGYCNDPAGGGSTCINCHFGTSTYPASGWITSNIPASGYVPGKTYSITAKATRFGHSKFGFEISPQNSSGNFLGNIILTDTNTQFAGLGSTYITHTYTGTSGNDSASWKFNWEAPSAKSGAVTFYGAFNITNSSFSTSGDTIAISTLTIPEDISSGISSPSTDESGLSVFPIPASEILNVRYTLTQGNNVEITIFDMNGKMVEVLLSENSMAGNATKSFAINGKYAEGAYFIKTSIGEQVHIEKIIIR